MYPPPQGVNAIIGTRTDFSSMKTRAPFVKYSKLGVKTVDIVEMFAADALATEAAAAIGVSVRSVNRIYQALRERLISLGMTDLGRDESYMDELLHDPKLAALVLERRARARGWQRRYGTIHWLETMHRYARPAHGPRSVLVMLLNSLILYPLGSLSPVRGRTHYFSMAQYHRSGGRLGDVSTFSRPPRRLPRSSTRDLTS